MLVMAGVPDHALASATDAVWQQIPLPRVRVHVRDAEDAEANLSEAVARLRSAKHQRTEERAHADHADLEPAHDHAHQTQHHSHHQHGGSEQHDEQQEQQQEQPGPQPQHAEHHGFAGDSGHDMGGMEMPGGISMADRRPDRDGLTLDALTITLGPVLPAWPSGLVVRTLLQGDVIQEASVATVGPAGESFWSGQPGIGAWRLDSCTRLLTVAGWTHAAAVAARLRDHVLAGGRLGADFQRWARQVRRSRVLRWSLSGVGVLDGPEWADTQWAGDAQARLVRWIEEIDGADGADDTDSEPELGPDRILATLPGLLAGTEFAQARLIVASLDPDLERVRAADG